MSFVKGGKRTIEAGKFADLAILSDDLLEVDEAKIPDIMVDHIIVSGRTVYERA